VISVTVDPNGTDEPLPAGSEGLGVTGEEPLGTGVVPSGRVDVAVEVSITGEVEVAGEV
jgi:hypothetical protein